MKRLLLLAALALGLVASSQAASITVATASATAQNVAFLLGTNSAATITGVTIVSTNNQVANVQFFDSYWATFQITNQAYHTITSYVTNLPVTWTNYYGRTNSYTNNFLVDITNTVATNNILLTPVFAAFAGTNSQTIYTPLNLKITQGLWLTNTTASSWASVTITYTQ